MESVQHKALLKRIDRLTAQLTEKDRIIENLRINNLFSGTVFDGIGDEIMVLDNEFNIKEVNSVFLQRYNLEKTEVLDKKCFEIKEKASAPCSINRACPLERARETGRRVEMTHDYKDADGNMKELVLIMYPLRSENQEIEYFLEISRDVSDYRVLIRELRESEKRFRAILDTATNAIISADEDQKIVLFNDAAEKIFGYKREEILGRDLNILIPDQYGDHYQYFRRLLKKRESDRVGKAVSLTSLRKNGEEFPIELSLSFMEVDGGITFTAIIKDVSEQKHMEKKLLQHERLAAVGKTVAHVAHELRNPLMIIGGFSNQIKDRLSDEKDAKKLDMILEEVTRLEKLVTVLGDFTKEYQLVKRSTDINSVIKDVLKIMAGVSQSETYAFLEIFAPDLEEIDCDPDKLKQVFINIISNGLEAMADGGTITIETKKTRQGVEIQISDEGAGISDEELQHIFEPFYTTREKGSGLGLAISYKIVEAHDGDISASSLPGRGTTFFIHIPAR
ncbi:PAS domain S-box protein [Thermodesulfobacteriota bacterium]